ncbi:MAG: RlmE family RNA methyltransferase [Candidatus Dadabacteria bacterium]|nr:MAG: RlmE family RNA methyltransferase [Candidatus Dadabacteria bacterium]
MQEPSAERSHRLNAYLLGVLCYNCHAKKGISPEMGKKKIYNRKDAYYRKAKKEGFRSRAAYKLKELNSKYGFLKEGIKALELGCWPGGWLEVASSAIGEKGVVVGIDLKEVEPLNSNCAVFLIQGDAGETEVLKDAVRCAGGKFHLLLSDMSPKLTGIRDVDEANMGEVYGTVLNAIETVLLPKGTLIFKGFKGEAYGEIASCLKKLFNKVKRIELDSTRKSSNEFYTYCTGYRG